MSKIALVLPGNTFHANHPSETMDWMDQERYALPVFRKWHVPALVFFQGLDFEMKPWLLDEMQTPGSLEWGNSTFSHTFIPLFPGSSRDETRVKIGTVPVTFFSEFYVPQGPQIPTEYTLVLAGNSALYSGFAEHWSPKQGDIFLEPYPHGAHAIRFQQKIGILLREEWFGPLLKAFFLFQRFPLAGSHPENRDCLAELVAQVRDIAEDTHDRVVVMPLDLEAPWIGSRFGAKVWEILFEELHRQNLLGVFTPVSSHLNRFKQEAVETPRPHRELTKWTTWEVQLNHMVRLNQFVPKIEHETIMRMIATGSDIFAAWGIKIAERSKRIKLPGVDFGGNAIEIPISFNQSVIDIQLAADRAMTSGSALRILLRKLNQKDPLIRTATEMAHRNSW